MKNFTKPWKLDNKNIQTLSCASIVVFLPEGFSFFAYANEQDHKAVSPFSKLDGMEHTQAP